MARFQLTSACVVHVIRDSAEVERFGNSDKIVAISGDDHVAKEVMNQLTDLSSTIWYSSALSCMPKESCMRRELPKRTGKSRTADPAGSATCAVY